MNNPLFDYDRFDRNFTSVEKTIKRTWFVLIFAWVFGGIISLSVLGGLVYVAGHFLAKIW